LLAADKEFAALAGEPTFQERLDHYNHTLQYVIAPHVDIGIVFVFAIGSLAAYAIVLGGWSSNNKYSLLGGLRSSAQLISYEIPMGMSVLGVMLVTGSLNIERMIDYQYYSGWNFIFQPLACLLFITSVFAETNRLPFDLPEAEQELIGGYHTEYSGMKFALYFLGEYTHMITTSFLVVALFFGGWLLPGVTSPETGGPGDMAVKVIIYGVKMILFIIFYMLIRWTIPRFRFDQLMGLAWKVMMPLTLVNFVMVLCIWQFRPLGAYSHWLMLPISIAVFVAAAVVSLSLPRAPTRAEIVGTGHPVTGGSRILTKH
jgi:NADH-quinone oxidoreductase subunit H